MPDQPDIAEVRRVQVAEGARVSPAGMEPVVILYVRFADTPDEQTAFALPPDIARALGGQLQDFAEKAAWRD